MDIQLIPTESDYKAALRQISTLMTSDPEPGTPEGTGWTSWQRWGEPARLATSPSARPTRLRRSSSEWNKADCA